jgi:FAD/FMN-containing dehydrogenase
MADHLITQLTESVDGQVIAPDDPTYDSARTVFAGGIDRRPAVIVRPRDADGVARVVRMARESGLPLAVRSGGHGGGLGVCDDGIVIDLAAIDDIEIDVDARTAWAGAGLTAGEYTAAAGEHQLATGFGDTGSVGLGGITLGGGVGYLSRRYGLTVDDLLGAEVVTAEGEVLQVDDDNHPDLFWAIRGGGGNFGVATHFRFRLHELPEVYGGMMILPATAETVTSFVELAADAPDELSTILNVMTAPPMPFLPPDLHGSLVAMALVCYAGPAEEGERVLAPFRALAEPLADMVAAMPYSGLYPPEDPDYHPTAVGRTLFLDSVDRDTAQMILDRLAASDAPLRVAQLRVLGGAVDRVPSDATAYAHRGARLMATVAAFYESADRRAARLADVEAFAAALAQGDDAVYVNFLNDDGATRVRAAYPGATWDRLVEVKRRYDPANLFRLNVNIPPDGA